MLLAKNVTKTFMDKIWESIWMLQIEHSAKSVFFLKQILTEITFCVFDR